MIFDFWKFLLSICTLCLWSHYFLFGFLFFLNFSSYLCLSDVVVFFFQNHCAFNLIYFDSLMNPMFLFQFISHNNILNGTKTNLPFYQAHYCVNVQQMMPLYYFLTSFYENGAVSTVAQWDQLIKSILWNLWVFFKGKRCWFHFVFVFFLYIIFPKCHFILLQWTNFVLLTIRVY